MTDRFPQILTASVTAGAVNDYATATISLPQANTSVRRGRRSVYEILKVWFYLAIEDLADASASNSAFISTTQIRASGDTSTLATMAADQAQPNVLASVYVNRTTGTDEVMPYCVDLTDDAGNGVLVATERIFLTGGNVTGTAAGSYTAKILYRIPEVPALEFVGIVQSQISGT